MRVQEAVNGQQKGSLDDARRMVAGSQDDLEMPLMVEMEKRIVLEILEVNMDEHP